jgi:hypothetical protein
MLSSLALISELLTIDHGKYLVKVTLQQEGIILGTGLAGSESIEKAEDLARERALGVLDLINKKFSQEIRVSPSQSNQEEQLPQKSTETKKEGRKFEVEQRESVVTFPQSKVTNSSTVEQITGEVEIPKPSLTDTDIAPKTTKSTPQSSSIPSLFDQKPSSPWELEQPAPTKEETRKSQPPLFIETEFSLTPPPLETGNSFEDSQGKEKNMETEIKSKSSEDKVKPKIEIPVDFSDIIAKIDLEMNRLGWTQEQGKQYLLQTYGKKSRHLLSDEELMEFVRYLESL